MAEGRGNALALVSCDRLRNAPRRRSGSSSISDDSNLVIFTNCRTARFTRLQARLRRVVVGARGRLGFAWFAPRIKSI